MLFILIGDDRTGKTILQKCLLDKLCGYGYERLPVNVCFDIKHPEIKRKYQNISFGNRSFQEKIEEYKSVDEYFSDYFKDADIAFISSHLVENDVKLMIENGMKRFYNVIGVFFSNSIYNNYQDNSKISLLGWCERLIVDNPITSDEKIDRQLDNIADNIVCLLINRTGIS